MLDQLKLVVADFRAALRGGPTVEPASPTTGERPDEPVAVGTPGEALDTARPIGGLPDHQGTQPARLRPIWSSRRVAAAGLLLVFAGTTAWQLGFLGEPEPADPNVVATYTGGVITKEQLVEKLRAHPETAQRQLASLEGLRHTAEQLALETVITAWAREKNLDEKPSGKDALKHASEGVLLGDVLGRLPVGQVRVDEITIQQYYEANRADFGERPLDEVRDAIRTRLEARQQRDLVANYLKDLRERASVTVDDALLTVPEPTSDEIADRYQRDRAKYVEPAAVRVAQVRVAIRGKEEEARAKAERARARLAAGEEFATVVQEVADAPAALGEDAGLIPRGGRTAVFDEAAFSLREGELSPVFKEDDAYVVVKVLERRRERQQPPEEVRTAVTAELRAEQEREVLTVDRDKTLFTLRGRRYTLGEFIAEVEELPDAGRTRFATAEARRTLLDALIDRLLLLDEASRQMAQLRNKNALDETRVLVLLDILHWEAASERLKLSDDEIRAAYERDPNRYAEPGRVKVSYIRVGRGGDAQAAQEKIAAAADRVRGGEAFATVARVVSEDPDTAARGGELDDWLGPTGDPVVDALRHELDEGLLSLKVGELSPVLVLGDSYYLFQIREKVEPRRRSFQDAREQVRQDLQVQKHARVLRDLEVELARRMNLRVYEGRIGQVLELVNAGQ